MEDDDGESEEDEDEELESGDGDEVRERGWRGGLAVGDIARLGLRGVDGGSFLHFIWFTRLTRGDST